MQIGAMNKQVQFMMPSKSRDSTGDQLEQWLTSSSIWANVNFLAQSDEQEITDKKTDVAQVIFTMYYNEATRPTWKILYNSDEYEILNVLTSDNMFMQIEARRYEQS